MSLTPKYREALDLAVSWIRENFDPVGIIAAGTIIRGNPDPNSDFDIFVLTRNFCQRVQRFFGGVPCEIFVNDPSRVREYFKEEHTAGRPCTANMVATGEAVYDSDPVVEELREEARVWLAKEPPHDPKTAEYKKYSAACKFEDYLDTMERDPAIAGIFLASAIELILFWYFYENRMFVPRGKELVSGFREREPELGALAERLLGPGTPVEKEEDAREFAMRTIGVCGFFEWSSDKESCG